MDEDLQWMAGLGLVDLLKEKKCLVGAEIGVSWGKTTEFLLSRLDLKRYYCVDPWQPYKEEPVKGSFSGSVFQSEEEANIHFREAMRRIFPHMDKVRVLEMTSELASKKIEDNELDFVFIDADHSFKAVTDDLNFWWPKVKTGGIFSGHDWKEFDVQPAVRRFFKDDPHEIKATVNDMWYVIK